MCVLIAAAFVVSAWLEFGVGSVYLGGSSVTLYAVFLAVALPTLLVWRLWPKPIKPGALPVRIQSDGQHEWRMP